MRGAARTLELRAVPTAMCDCKTDRKERMKESYVEGLATHDDPESYVGVREDAGEALTGARAGRVLSREINSSERRRCPERRKATRGAPLARGVPRLCAVRDPEHVRNLLCRSSEIHVSSEEATRAALGKAEAISQR